MYHVCINVRARKVRLMRNQLNELGKKIKTYTATFSCLGLKQVEGKKRKPTITPTICLDNIRDEQGNRVANHLWFNYTAPFYTNGELEVGDKLIFRAKSRLYHKGARKQKADYKLSQPSAVKVIADHPRKPLPSDKEAIIGYVMHIEKHRGIGHFSQAFNDWAAIYRPDLITMTKNES